MARIGTTRNTATATYRITATGRRREPDEELSTSAPRPSAPDPIEKLKAVADRGGGPSAWAGELTRVGLDGVLWLRPASRPHGRGCCVNRWSPLGAVQGLASPAEGSAVPSTARPCRPIKVLPARPCDVDRLASRPNRCCRGKTTCATCASVIGAGMVDVASGPHIEAERARAAHG